MKLTRIALAAILCLAPVAGAAHPHVFIEVGATFVFDDENRLAAVRIEHRYDALVSLFVLNEFGIDPFSPLSDDSVARLVEDQAAMLKADNGFAALAVERRDTPLHGPDAVTVSLREDRLQVAFALRLAAPVALEDQEATLAVFDPVYFIAFEMDGAVMTEGGTGCAAEAVEWAPTDVLAALESSLFSLAADEVPDDPTVGRLFAAKARATCR
ncbi:DUF1007 family protein [Rubrimonas cliftonensis]|uniref:ABC-type uncharacterized transport system, substrate-binding protein n=1 Tax=Rubrimonas cliftonensis TaxID=89524 RepID=A0A1H4EZV0_9RHOB|nr:DUF1007 family protein [Rubrimonas cliftonensis]SEA90220.1 ABC-type uncharacterized transport system, substrate-binding protein [Rubrimonas cliftonensis]